MTVKEQYIYAYKTYVRWYKDVDKYGWVSSEIFELTTYDSSLDKLFVEKICEVCKQINDRKVFEYIKISRENYITYIVVCQLLKDKGWINWGSSIRGAFFDEFNSSSEFILDSMTCIPFTIENLLTLIEFIEEQENE